MTNVYKTGRFQYVLNMVSLQNCIFKIKINKIKAYIVSNISNITRTFSYLMNLQIFFQNGHDDAAPSVLHFCPLLSKVTATQTPCNSLLTNKVFPITGLREREQ